MLLCGRQRLLATAVPTIGKKCGMNFTPALQPHKKSVVVLGRLVNPTDSRRA
jgi:hypothetical protein